MPLRQEDSEARRAIIREWDDWARNNPADSNSAAGCALFFVHLQQEKSELLDFHSTSDKWQMVHGWLRREGRVKTNCRNRILDLRPRPVVQAAPALTAGLSRIGERPSTLRNSHRWKSRLIGFQLVACEHRGTLSKKLRIATLLAQRRNAATSAYGTKRTSMTGRRMSALGGKADMPQTSWKVGL